MIARAFFVALLVTAALLPAAVLAQVTEPPVSAVITGPNEVAVGRTIVLDASASVAQSGAVTYAWYEQNFAQPISRSVEALFTPETPGEYTVRLTISQEINGEDVTSEVTHVITAYTRKVVLIADSDFPAEKIAAYTDTARSTGVYFQVLRPSSANIPLGTEEAFTQLLSDQFDRLSNAEAIVLWTADPVAGMQALLRSARSEEARLQVIRNQSIIIISERSLSTLARALRAPFSVLKPLQLLLTRKEAMQPFLEAPSLDAFSQTLATRDIEVVIQDVSALTPMPWNVLTVLVTYMLTHGVAGQTVILLLMLPVIATILAFLKQVIGVTTFGLYTPSIIALSFLALGWPAGVILLTFILLASYAARKALKKLRLLYVPKIAIILTAVSMTLLVALALGAALDFVLTTDTVFVLLIMSTLAESFLTIEGAEGKISALYGIIETVLAALLCVFIVRWPALQSFIMAYPESVLLTVGANILFGRYTGLRLFEYFRFRAVFDHLKEE